MAKRFVKRAKNMQIIVGVSAPGFAAMRSLARASMDAGAAGVMIAPPPHLRTDDQITGYFKQAVEAIGDDIPWVLQDYPLTLSVVFTPAVIRKIVMDSPSCVMLKHEDWPGLEKISALRGFQKDGSLRPLSILTGNGGLFLDFEMERGADGAMTGYAFPELLIDVVRLSKEASRDAAHDLFDAHLPLIRYEQQPGAGLAVRKYVLQKRGVIASSAQRKPGASITAAAKAEVDYLLSRVARVDKRANLQPQSSAAGRILMARRRAAPSRAMRAHRILRDAASGLGVDDPGRSRRPASRIDHPAAARQRRQRDRGLHDGAPL